MEVRLVLLYLLSSILREKPRGYRSVRWHTICAHLSFLGHYCSWLIYQIPRDLNAYIAVCGNVKTFSPNQVWLGAYIGNDVQEIPELIGIFQLCAGAVTAAL